MDSLAHLGEGVLGQDSIVQHCLPTTIPLRVQRDAERVGQQLRDKSISIKDAIRTSGLYFRVSVVGACNLACAFCHNEGGPRKGRIDSSLLSVALCAAKTVGFRRVQFTGGEPLVHPGLAAIVTQARQMFDDVGVTSNGVYAPRQLEPIVRAGVTRLHISLQYESLELASTEGRWGSPNWLKFILDAATNGPFSLRLNMPVPRGCEGKAAAFLAEMRPIGCDVLIFSILPTDACSDESGIDELQHLAHQENTERARFGVAGRIALRSYKAPLGIRCETCLTRTLCREQSHSLRLGVDGVLRPCLASRDWDFLLDRNNVNASLKTGALLALDFKEW